MKTKLIILDRDGVINYDSDNYIKTPKEWVPIPGSLNAIAKLKQAGFSVVIATNQSGVARGLYDLAMLEQIHNKLIQSLAHLGAAVDDIFFCPHHPDELCNCRKPKLGLFQQIQSKYAVQFADTYFIGDSYTDIKAALSLGCKPILVLTGNGKKTLDQNPQFKNIAHFSDLATAVDYILADATHAT